MNCVPQLEYLEFVLLFYCYQMISMLEHCIFKALAYHHHGNPSFVPNLVHTNLSQCHISMCAHARACAMHPCASVLMHTVTVEMHVYAEDVCMCRCVLVNKVYHHRHGTGAIPTSPYMCFHMNMLKMFWRGYVNLCGRCMCVCVCVWT